MLYEYFDIYRASCNTKFTKYLIPEEECPEHETSEYDQEMSPSQTTDQSKEPRGRDT